MTSVKNTFKDTLFAEKGHPKYQEKLKPYEIFIGTWDFDWVGHEDDGSTWTVPGQWHFSWILDGRAIQDTWICPKIALRNSGKYLDGEYGTTIRFYDFKEDCIKVIWVGPILSRLDIFKVALVNDQIIQDEILFGNKKQISKWLFKDISKSTFKWEAYVSSVELTSWKLVQEVFAKRKF